MSANRARSTWICGSDLGTGAVRRGDRAELEALGYRSGMTIKLNHTIVHSTDKRAAAAFFVELFGLPEPKTFGPFLDVQVANEVTLAFLDADGMEIQAQHYAFLVSEQDFDQIFRRLQERGTTYWADPHQTQEGTINHHYGGRGVYFEDPSGHLLEIITRPYGSELPQ
jgi:catechol 2,3-dioxygenase-like lactoylglutathione lyase family enzyme